MRMNVRKRLRIPKPNATDKKITCKTVIDCVLDHVAPMTDLETYTKDKISKSAAQNKVAIDESRISRTTPL